MKTKHPTSQVEASLHKFRLQKFRFQKFRLSFTSSDFKSSDVHLSQEHFDYLLSGHLIIFLVACLACLLICFPRTCSCLLAPAVSLWLVVTLNFIYFHCMLFICTYCLLGFDPSSHPFVVVYQLFRMVVCQ